MRLYEVIYKSLTGYVKRLGKGSQAVDFRKIDTFLLAFKA